MEDQPSGLVTPTVCCHDLDSFLLWDFQPSFNEAQPITSNDFPIFRRRHDRRHVKP